MLAGVLDAPSPQRKKIPDIFKGRCRLYTFYLDASQVSHSRFPLPFHRLHLLKDNIIVFLILTEILLHFYQTYKVCSSLVSTDLERR